MSREDWLQARKNTLGGSDSATVVGLNPYSSKFALWAEKTGRIVEKEDSEAMRQGRDLEEYVAKRFCEKTGKKVRRDNSIIFNSDYPFAHANVDRLIVGEDAGLECKTTTTLNLKQFKNGEYPVNYYVQCMHYMLVTGKKRWYLAVLVLGKGFYDFVIDRDESEIKALAEAEKDFYQYITDDKEPPVDGMNATTDAISEIYADDNGGVASLIGLEKVCAQLNDVRAEIDRLSDVENELKNKIKDAMGVCSEAQSDEYYITWKGQTRSTFDTKAFSTAYPDIDLSQFYKKTSSRVFKFKKIEEN